MGLLILTIGVIGIAMAAMAVGAMFSGRCLRGSCGGPEVTGPDGESLSCDTCPLKRRQDRVQPTRSKSSDGRSIGGV